MRLTALDIREQQFRRIMRGFDPDEVVTFLGAVASEYEQLVSENRDIRQRLLDLEHQIAEFQNMEKALRDTLLTAERVTSETRENAHKEAGLILREAEMAAQQATAGISAEILQKRRELSELQQRKKDYLFGVRALAQSHLQMIDSAAHSIGEEMSFVSMQTSTVRPVPAFEPSAQSDLVRASSASSPLPTGAGGVIPSAAAPGGVVDAVSPGMSPWSHSEAAPVLAQVEAAGPLDVEFEIPRRSEEASGWAEASFEPGDLVPRNTATVPVSAREAELYRRGITTSDPLPSLLRAPGSDGNTVSAGSGRSQGAWDPTSESETAHGTDIQNPAHAVRPDGTQGD